MVTSDDEEEEEESPSADQVQDYSSWKHLPKTYSQADKEFVLSALKNYTELPSKANFERRFTRSLHNDRDVVLAFCARNDFEKLYYERHLFVPECLTCDKDVMLAYCRKIPRSLQDCTEELRDDRDVVQAAISFNGMELQYASLRLQEDKEMVTSACRRDGRALEFCPEGAVRDELTRDRTFMMSVLRGHGFLFRLLDESLRGDRELVLEALANGMRFRYCPDAFKEDKSFLVTAVTRKSSLYLEMNRICKASREIARAAVIANNSPAEVHKRALDIVPSLCRDRKVALAIAERGEQALLKKLLSTGDESFRDDKSIMLTAVKRDCKLFQYMSPRLREDPEILVASFDEKSALTLLRSISADIKRDHPQITIRAVEVASRPLDLHPYIPAELWTNRAVAVAWIRRGCGVLPQFRARLEYDEKMALEVAEHCWDELWEVGQFLRGSLRFMMRAVEKDGRCLRFASPVIQGNLDLAVRAVANHQDALVRVSVDRENLKGHIQSKLNLQKSFISDFLRGITIAPIDLPPEQLSNLTMLNLGVETIHPLAKSIAEYLDVPIGSGLGNLRKALANLNKPPAPRGESEDSMEARRRRRRFRDRDPFFLGDLFMLDDEELEARHHWLLEERQMLDEAEREAPRFDRMRVRHLRHVRHRLFRHMRAQRDNNNNNNNADAQEGRDDGGDAADVRRVVEPVVDARRVRQPRRAPFARVRERLMGMLGGDNDRAAMREDALFGLFPAANGAIEPEVVDMDDDDSDDDDSDDERDAARAHANIIPDDDDDDERDDMGVVVIDLA